MSRRAEIEQDDPRCGLCAYHVGALYCPLPGSLSSHTGPGRAAAWYCRHHIEPASRDGDARAIEDIIAHQGVLRRAQSARGLLWDAKAGGYTRELAVSTIAPHGGASIAQRRAATLAAHPEWQRGENEGKAAYQMRMRGELERLLGRRLQALVDFGDVDREADEEREAIRSESA